MTGLLQVQMACYLKEDVETEYYLEVMKGENLTIVSIFV